MREEPVDIALGKSAEMPLLVERDMPANLMHVGFFSASAVMANPEDSEQMIVEPGHRLS
ncbi:MAG: hypothetical protein ACQESR_28170 [Planctomycetota bacterium]